MAENKRDMFHRASDRVQHRLASLVRSDDPDEDRAQAQTTINATLLVFLVLLSFLFLIAFENAYLRPQYRGISIPAFALIYTVFVELFVLGRRGYAKAAAYGLVLICFAGSCYCGWRWGASLPATLLLFALLMGIANLLLGIRTGLAVMAASFAALLYLGTHERMAPQILAWRSLPSSVENLVSYFAIIAFMFVVSWISRRELERSLRRARRSEKALAAERDLLEARVTERTEELRRSQEERIGEIEHIAEFGRLSQGLFHDLLSSLSSLMLYLETASGHPQEKAAEAERSAQKIAVAARRFGGYLTSIRRGLGAGRSEGTAVFEEELDHVIDLLAFKAREKSVSFLRPEQPVGRIPLEPMRLHRVLFNLLSNAVDAYVGASGDGKKTVEIRAKIGSPIEDGKRDTASVFLLQVGDQGCGIAAADLPRVFDPFYTTKAPSAGTGIGLASAKRLIEEKGGTIRLESIEGRGTEVTVAVPFRAA